MIKYVLILLNYLSVSVLKTMDDSRGLDTNCKKTAVHQYIDKGKLFIFKGRA